MLDIKFIRENLSLVQKAAEAKKANMSLDDLFQLDKDRKVVINNIEEINRKRRLIAEKGSRKGENAVSSDGKTLRYKLYDLEERLKKIEDQRNKLLLQIPNVPQPDVEDGKDESENKVIRKWGEPRKFDFTPKDHVELGEILDIIDIKRAAKVSGTRFGYLKNEAALLEFALVQFALEILTKEGFAPVIPPVLFRRSTAIGLGYFQGKDNDEYYWVPDTDLKSPNPEDHHGYYLVGTAEHSIVPMHKDETFYKKELPKRYVGFSSAFRREAGSYGKDTRGILRVHQFDKVEMVSFVTEENGDKEHEYFLSLEEKLFQLLGIPYQVVKMCTGDLGFPTARKYDIEAWIPSQNKYREVTSTSTTTDFQARRLNIKYQNGNEKKYVHILNGTAFAIGRTIVAILENYQQEDRSVIIPKVLRKYLNNLEKITPKKH